jgi:hypothetical protein
MNIPELHEIENTDFVDEMTAEECFNYFRDHTESDGVETCLTGEYPSLYKSYRIELCSGSYIYEKQYVVGNKIATTLKETIEEPARIWRSLLKQYLQHHIDKHLQPE